jgi:hypothetical protein
MMTVFSVPFCLFSVPIYRPVSVATRRGAMLDVSGMQQNAAMAAPVEKAAAEAPPSLASPATVVIRQVFPETWLWLDFDGQQ